MGFIEDLRRQRIQQEDQKRLDLQAEEKKRAVQREEQKRKEQEEAKKATLRKENLRKAEEQFEQTGIKQMAQVLLDMNAARSLGQYDIGYHNDDSYRTRLIIKEDPGNKDDQYYYSSSAYYYVGITVSPDGAVIFEGEEKETQIRYEGFLGLNRVERVETVPLEITISKNEWQGKNGQERLEEALEKAYLHPKKMPKKLKPHYDFTY